MRSMISINLNIEIVKAANSLATQLYFRIYIISELQVVLNHHLHVYTIH